MKIKGFIQVLPGIWYEKKTGKPWSSKVCVGRGPGGGKGVMVKYDGPMKPLKINIMGYYHVCINGKAITWQRIVYRFFKGFIPKGLFVDHIDNNRYDNRYKNLQLLNFVDNCRKQLKHKANTSGYTGVSYDKVNNKWKAQISMNRNKNINLGRYNTPEEAYKVYLKAKVKYHGNKSILPLL